MLKFSEFWMIICFALIGCWAGQTYAEHIHYPDLGVGAWLGALAGLTFAFVFMLPVSNETARWKMKMLRNDLLEVFFYRVTEWRNFRWVLFWVMAGFISLNAGDGLIQGNLIKGLTTGFLWGFICDASLVLLFLNYKAWEKKQHLKNLSKER